MDYRGRTRGKWLSGSALLCLALAACNKAPQGTAPVTGAPIAAMQLATAAPPPPTYAPPASALPPAPRAVAYRPSPQHWRYLTDAYDMSDAFADTPPDYTVAYDGEDPYVWRADDGAYRVVEWLPDGARYYYYEPGADEPFLIQDPEYSYAYDNGALVAVYTLAGALVADRIAAEREAYAARYYARGHDLYRAAQQDRRRAAYADNWRERAPMIQAQRERWRRGRQDQPGWQDWNRAHQAEQEKRWAPERQHRATYAAALGAAGAAIAMHHHDQQAAQRAANARPASPPPVNTPRNPRGGRPDAAERHAEADRAQPGLLHDTAQPPRAHGPQSGTADRHAETKRPEPPRPQAAQPDMHGPHGSQDRAAARQAMAHAEQAQRQGAQQAQQAQRHEQQQAQQAQKAARQAQRAELHAQAHPTAQPVQAPRPQPQHAEAPHPQAAHPAPQPQQQPQKQQHPNGADRKDDRHHH